MSTLFFTKSQKNFPDLPPPQKPARCPGAPGRARPPYKYAQVVNKNARYVKMNKKKEVLGLALPWLLPRRSL